MKFYFIIVLSMLLFINNSSAKNHYQKGIIIMKNNDSIPCMIDVHKPNIIIQSINLKYKINKEKFNVKFSDIKRVVLDTVIYEYLSPGFETSQSFALLAVDGQYKLYKTYSYRSNINGSFLVATNYIKTQNGELIEISDLTFRKTLSSIFKDCPLLTEKINSKELKYNDLDAIVNFANNNCK